MQLCGSPDSAACVGDKQPRAWSHGSPAILWHAPTVSTRTLAFQTREGYGSSSRVLWVGRVLLCPWQWESYSMPPTMLPYVHDILMPIRDPFVEKTHRIRLALAKADLKSTFVALQGTTPDGHPFKRISASWMLPCLPCPQPPSGQHSWPQ